MRLYEGDRIRAAVPVPSDVWAKALSDPATTLDQLQHSLRDVGLVVVWMRFRASGCVSPGE